MLEYFLLHITYVSGDFLLEIVQLHSICFSVNICHCIHIKFPKLEYALYADFCKAEVENSKLQFFHRKRLLARDKF